MRGAGIDPEQLFEQFGDLFADLFGGANNFVTLQLTDAQAAAGITIEAPIERAVGCSTCEGHGTASATAAPPCTACDGKGQHAETHGALMLSKTCAACAGAGRIIRQPCGGCAGSGRQRTAATVTVVVPPGAAHAETIRIPGAGSLGRDGQVADVHVYLLVGGRPDPRVTEDAAKLADAEALFAMHGLAAEPQLPRAVVRQRAEPGSWLMLALVVLGLLIAAALLAR